MGDTPTHTATLHIKDAIFGSRNLLVHQKVCKAVGWAACKLGGGKQLVGATRRTRKSRSYHDTTPILSTLDGFYYDKG